MPGLRVGSKTESLSAFGRAASASATVTQPTCVEDIVDVLEYAHDTQRQVVLRGAGQSYGDAALAPEALAIRFDRMDRILQWDPSQGVIDCDPGVRIAQLWRYCLPEGWWPPVVSGTSRPTLGGALAMNIHGKNAWKAGPIGDYVKEIDVLTPDGRLQTLTPFDAAFFAVVGSAGLLGVITRIRLQMKRVSSGYLKVLALNPQSWEEQFQIFEEYQHHADYMISWVDGFATGPHAGRGQFHASWYAVESTHESCSLTHDAQYIPDTVFGWFPKSLLWRFLRPLNTNPGMKLINTVKCKTGNLSHGHLTYQTLTQFSFLLDSVPDWQNAYFPGGFIQYQSFVPASKAPEVFKKQLETAQDWNMPPFLAVLKRHMPDPYLISYGVDGYSLALDFKIRPKHAKRLWELCHQLNDMVLDAGGRFYFAKDITLRPSDVRNYLGASTLAEFRRLKAQFDPAGLLTSSLAQRVRLFKE